MDEMHLGPHVALGGVRGTVDPIERAQTKRTWDHMLSRGKVLHLFYRVRISSPLDQRRADICSQNACIYSWQTSIIAHHSLVRWLAHDIASLKRRT